MSWFFFFNDTATTEIYTLSLHDALPISRFCSWLFSFCELTTMPVGRWVIRTAESVVFTLCPPGPDERKTSMRRSLGDRKSTRLNSSHANISYAVFCLKKKKTQLEHLSIA